MDELYGEGKLSPEMTGELYKVAAKIFRNVIGKKIFTVGSFETSRKDKSVRCSLKGRDGLLFPLRKSFIFIHKPTTFIAYVTCILLLYARTYITHQHTHTHRYDTVSSVEFQRYSSVKGQMKSRTFDLQISYRPGGTVSSAKEIVFQGIGRDEFKTLFDFLKKMDINIANIKSLGVDGDGDNPDYNEDDDSDFVEDEGSDGSDSDWDGGDGGDGSDDDDDDDGGDDSEEEKPKKKRRKKND